MFFPIAPTTQKPTQYTYPQGPIFPTHLTLLDFIYRAHGTSLGFIGPPGSDIRVKRLQVINKNPMAPLINFFQANYTVRNQVN